MKRLKIILVVLIVIWNIFLTIEVIDLHKKGNNNDQNTIVNNIVSGFSTDLTKIVPSIQKSIVGVRTEFGYSTGVIYQTVDNTAYILTNYHSIENAGNIDIMFDNLDRVKADIVGYDKVMDVSVLRLDSVYELSPIKVGDSSLLKQGEFVLAIGNPLSVDYHGSLTFGIISSPNRIVDVRIDKTSYFINMIQSDITLNSGNSGSALINMAGELVGLNTMSLEIGDAKGMSFSIPINELKLIADEIIENGSVSKVNLGLKVTEVSSMPNYLKSNLNINLDITEGLYVSEIKNDFFGYLLGIRSGDIILEINGVEIKTINDYIKEEYKIKDRISVTIIRNNEHLTYERETGLVD